MEPLARATLGILVIPFPFAISDQAFRPAGSQPAGRWGWFEMDALWLPGTEEGVSQFVDWVASLVAQTREKDDVHGIVFPELALNQRLFSALVERFATDKKMDFIIAGVHDDESGRRGNFVSTAPLYFLNDPQLDRLQVKASDAALLTLTREKHHRWRLTPDQIKRYGLEDRFQPDRSWWEHLEIWSRSLDVLVYRGETTLTTLICEDLARVDPCQVVLRSVGPNLVIALLMDGPQLPERWPGRYATGLADDPGSSVLSVTSVALIDRKPSSPYAQRYAVGLWKDDEGFVRVLDLPRKAHAILVTLTSEYTTEYTLDGRSDDHAAIAWRYKRDRPIMSESLPTWIETGLAPRS